MKTDVIGRIRNISLAASKPLLPLYEAIVNSIQAIEDACEANGHIRIAVHRDVQMYHKQDPELSDIIGFDITDNGIGFTDENYRAFETSDTTYKVGRGGKGIGRFLWLVAFAKVNVTSHYEEGGKFYRRTFNFVSDGDGIQDLQTTDSPEKARKTVVTLKGFREKYYRQCPKKLDTIATHLIEHCLEYFIRSDCPYIILEDLSSERELNLNERFEHEIAGQSSSDSIIVEGHKLEILHVRLYSSHLKDHQLHFCADSRVVKSENLNGRIPNLSHSLHDHEGKAFVYAGYVDGEILNRSVNAERTYFAIPQDDSELYSKSITWRAIQTNVYEKCKEFLKPYTDPVKERKKKRIEDFIATDGPMYRPILKHVEDKIDLIDPEISDDDLDLKLYQAYQGFQVDLRSQGQKLLQQEVKDEEWEDFAQQLQAYFDKISDINKSDLARYVCHRRAVLDFLYKQLSFTQDRKYQREERIHQIVFPRGKTSEDVCYDEHNLWLIDEKLVYHSFLSSDKPLSANPQVSTDSRKEPDILIFDKACAFTTGKDIPFSSVTIVEFKRPMRDDYKPEENPFVQVRKYVVDIRDGRARTVDGRDIPVVKSIPFFCYIVCDPTSTLEQQAYDFELTKTPDGQGYFGYKREYNAYFEVLSYSKMVADAKKRNAAFFDKLGLPIRIGQ